MVRRLIVSSVLAALLVVLQLVAGNPWSIALLTGAIGLVVAFGVLVVSDRYFRRRT